MSDRSLWCWGATGHGAPVAYCQGPCLAPKKVELGMPVLEVAMDDTSTCVLLSDGRVDCASDRNPRTFFRQASGLVQGRPSSGVLTGRKNLVTHGSNHDGQLGFSVDTAQKKQPVLPLQQVQVGDKVREAFIGTLFGCSLSGDGKLRCFGNGFGCSGPQPVNVPGGVRRIRGAGSAMCVLTVDRRLFVVHEYQRGLPNGVIADCDFERFDLDQLFSSPLATDIVDAACYDWPGSNRGLGSGCAINQEGNAFCWRDGVGRGPVEGDPYKVLPMRSLPPIRQVSVGLDFACAVTTSDRLLCWGSNKYGQLGRGYTSDTWESVPAEPAWPVPTVAESQTMPP